MRPVIAIIFSCFCTTLSAQQLNNYTFRHLDQRDGLLHNNIISIRQDAKGFIWILTLNGLQRYDGTRFINYQGIVNNAANGMTNGAELFSDNIKNEVWVLKKNIMEKLTLSNNRFSNYEAGQLVGNPEFKFDTYTDEYNNRCLLGDKGIFIFPAATDKLSSAVLNIHPLNLHEGNVMARDSLHNQTWLITSRSLLLFDGDTKKVFSKRYNPAGNRLLQAYTIGKASPRLIMADSRSDCWITTWGGLFYRFHRQTGKLTTYDLSSIKKMNNNKKDQDATLLINAIFEDNHSNVWLATENAGLLLYHEETDDFGEIPVDQKNIQSLQYNFKINCIFQDKEDNIWLGTDKGISIFNPYRQYFKSIRHEESIPSVPKKELLNSIQTVNGDILVATWGGGITVYDDHWNFKKNILFPNPQQYNMVWCFAQNDDGNIWAGCQHGYIHIYDPAAETIKTIRPPEFDNSTIRCMVKDISGNIWFGLNNGNIVEWDKLQNKFYPYNDKLRTEINRGASVFKIFIDKAQHFWVSTESGFKEFDPAKRVYTWVHLPCKGNPDSISGMSSQGIEALDDTTLLIGTIYGGLNFFNTRKRTFSHLTTDDGLPSNTIYAIKKDTAGFVWFTTDYNLYKFKPATKKFIHFNMEPGIINSSFNTTGFYALRDGTWLTASTTEIICFQPAKIIQDNENTKVEITGFRVFDSPLFIDSLLFQNMPVHLSYKQNFFSVEFALLNFSSLQQPKYYYRLSDVNKDWVSAGTKNFAGYTNLNPGKYTFSVKTENDLGMSEPTSFTIIISPALWQSWWFKLLGIAVALFIAYRSVRRRIKEIRHEAQMKQKIAETEMMALRAQMNPHFIFNCLNSIDNLIQMNEKEKATAYLSKFARLIRSILESSDKNVVPCWKDIETLKLYLELEELRWDKKISYKLIVSDEILNGDYKVPPLIIQPFVENAIHHGLLNKLEGSKELLIQVSVVNNQIHYLVEDNGVGRAKADMYKLLNKQSNQSMGMQITTDRINLFNRKKNGFVKITDLVNELQEPCGTKVEIKLINQS